MNVNDKVHDRHCAGHIDCPTCGPDQCACPVVHDDRGRVQTVVCLNCFEPFAVEDLSWQENAKGDSSDG